ncbi:hypothetical protein [Marinicella rhabdoformis]|uniref:hypothetical protein n=1 Tax=Marinicella rhabdoformis TaxID=2580566 RepID=UPI0012AEC974|nr:hypothetical protein [Marinicella rhabdoformis]
MSKVKVSFVHFLISAIFILLFCAFVYFVWYQQVYFNVSGVGVPLKLLFVVDVILGPLLTLIIYKEGKKYLKMDLLLIALFQLIAFFYGVYNIYLGKPSLVIHRTGYLEVVIEKDIDYDLLSDEMNEQGFWLFPVYGKIESDLLSPVSNVHDYLSQVTPFDVQNKVSFTRPLTLDQARDTFKNSSTETKKDFDLINQKNKNYIYYELKFEQIYGVLIIDKSNLQFKTVLTP